MAKVTIKHQKLVLFVYSGFIMCTLFSNYLHNRFFDRSLTLVSKTGIIFPLLFISIERKSRPSISSVDLRSIRNVGVAKTNIWLFSSTKFSMSSPLNRWMSMSSRRSNIRLKDEAISESWLQNNRPT